MKNKFKIIIRVFCATILSIGFFSTNKSEATTYIMIEGCEECLPMVVTRCRPIGTAPCYPELQELCIDLCAGGGC